jgi:hypothetical protein
MRPAALVFLIAPLLRQDEPLRHPWDGFAAGSWIQCVQFNRNNFSTVFRKTREEFSRDLVAPIAPEAGLVLTGRRDDTLIVGDRRLDCEVLQYAGPDDEPSRWISLTLWKARGVSLPAREVWTSPTIGLASNVVKLLRCELRGDWTTALALDVVDLDCKIAVNGGVLDSSIEDVFTTTAATDRPTGIRGRRRWICDAIPGRLARRDETCLYGDGGGYYTVEVTEFKAVR